MKTVNGDVDKVTDLIFEVSFSPGQDSLALPHAHTDSIKSRDAVLKQLKSLGATVECNNILHLRPHDAPSSASVAENVDSAGCGDGKKTSVSPVTPGLLGGLFTFPDEVSTTTRSSS